MVNVRKAPFIATGEAVPTLLDQHAALEWACEVIVDAGQAGAHWIIFPQAAIPSYPDWVWTIRPGDDPLLDELRAAALAGAVPVPGDMIDRLCRVAQRARINVVIGLIERESASGGTAYYHTLLAIDAAGRVLGRYRWHIAAGVARPVWLPGDGSASAHREQQRQAQDTPSVRGI
jgi:predicted amidohydrolase